MVDTKAGVVVQQGADIAASMSIDKLFLEAELVVQLVVVALIFASFFSWSIIFSKFLLLRKARRDAKILESAYRAASSVSTFLKETPALEESPVWRLATMCVREVDQFAKAKPHLSFEETEFLATRLYRSMGGYVRWYMAFLSRRLVYLATIGSTATFVGLFGTVWGIIHSFQSIALSKNTSLAVVAPGIAEALFATALGLVAAVPAWVAYNRLASSINEFGLNLEGFMDVLVKGVQDRFLTKGE